MIVPPALPLYGPLGRVVNPHALTRFDATSITSTGAPLPPAVQNPLARTFSVDLTPIRVHTDAGAQRVVRSLSTRAFAYGNNIFLGPGEQPADLRLMAHEVAHVIQQSRSATLQHFTSTAGNVFEQEAEAASSAAVRGVPFTVRQRTAPQPQGLFGISLPNPLTWLMNRANSIPGFRMLTVILGRNPINGETVPRSAANILRALVAFVPGGELIIRALDNYGIFDRVGSWVEEQINSLGMTAGAIRTAVTEFISSLSARDLLHLGGLLDRAIRIFTTPIDQLISFGRRIATGIIGLIKDAILLPLARLASQTRGWNLLIAVLGRNPITGEAVPRTAETLIGGFMRLIGQEEVWANIQRARVVPRAWAWFQGALEGLLGQVRDIPSRFVSELRQLEVIDIVILPRAFMRIGRVFTGFLGSFLSWAGNQVLGLLQIIFEGVAPRAMPYLQRTAGALSSIFRNPGGFARNLVRAGRQGFEQFKNNFLNHLRRSLIEWLTGAMSGAGLYIPQALNFREILKFALSVLGLTWQNLRTKLVRAIGPTAVSVLETTFDLVVTLVREGPAAAWERIRESISNLREMVMEGIMNFVRQRIVVAAITMLASSLIPGAGFIRAIMSIYDTVMFFVDRARQIAQTVVAYIDSLAAIASGNISAAANRVEATMARTLTVVISFLASILRLGRVTDAITEVLNRIRQPIDQALDRVADWIRNMVRNLASRILGGDPNAPSGERTQRGLAEAVAAVNRYSGQTVGGLILQALLTPIKLRHRLSRLEVVAEGDTWSVEAAASARRTARTAAKVAPTTTNTIVRYNPSGALSGKSIEVYAFPLTHLPGTPPPSPANRDNPLFPRAWTHVTNERRPKKAWRRTHLLSAALQGPGNIEANIVPAVERINSRLRSGPEEWGKTEIIRKRHIIGWYRVIVTYTHPPPHDEFPKSISVQGGFCSGPSNNLQPGRRESGANFSDRSLELPNLGGRVATGPISIRQATWRQLRAAFSSNGMTQYVAQWLAGKVFARRSTVKRNMQNSSDNRISSNADTVDTLMSGSSPRLGV